MPFYTLDKPDDRAYIEAILTCDCNNSEEHIAVSMDSEVKIFMLYPSFEYQHPCRSLRSRISAAWSIIMNKPVFPDDMILDFTAARSFAEWILKRIKESEEKSLDE